MNFSFDDLLDRLATRAFDHITEGLGARTGLYFCPRDRVPMIKLPSGMYLCPTCETKFAREAPQQRRPPGSVGNDSTDDAFRFFDPFRNNGKGKRSQRYGEGVPPRAGRAPGAPTGRRRMPQPVEPPNVLLDAYRELSLKPPVTAADVKRRRNELARQHHPDVGGDVKKMARINAAADLLLEVL